MTAAWRGPYFDELTVGTTFDSAPAVTLTEGLAAAHQAILGDRFRLTLDAPLASRVTGLGVLAGPSLVWNVAIGQSTLATQHVKANLFYRDFALLRQASIGDTLHTSTTVVGLRENSRREGRRPTGLAALHMRTFDQHARPVLDFYRCAMLPLLGDEPTGHDDDLAQIGGTGRDADALVPEWASGTWRQATRPATPGSGLPRVGEVVEVLGGDVITSAPELARMTLNVASVHHDERAAGGRRLVYGGHVIGLCLSQVTRALPNLASIVSWEFCDHEGSAHEGDTLRTSLEVTGLRQAPRGWSLLDMRCKASTDDGGLVLTWQFTALV